MKPAEIIKSHLAYVPASARGVMRKACEGTASPRAAIKAKCLECVGYIRKDVRECTSPACPLYPYRPFQKGDAEAHE